MAELVLRALHLLPCQQGRGHGVVEVASDAAEVENVEVAVAGLVFHRVL